MLIQTCTIIYTYVNSIWKGDKNTTEEILLLVMSCLKFANTYVCSKNEGWVEYKNTDCQQLTSIHRIAIYYISLND